MAPTALAEPLAPASRPRASWLDAARVPKFAHFLLLPLAGYDPDLPIARAAIAMGRGVGIAFSVLAFGYLLNGLSDRHMDASREKNPLVGGEPASSHWLALSLLFAAAVGLSLTGPWPVPAATAVCLGSGVVYSVGPRLKRIPLLGTLANATNFAPLLWVGIASGSVPRDMAQLTAIFTCLLLQNQLLHEAADREEDLRGSVHTSVLVFGPRASAAAAAVLGALAGITMAIGSARASIGGILAALFGIGFPIVLAIYGHDARRMGDVRIAHRVFCLLAGAGVFACLRLGG